MHKKHWEKLAFAAISLIIFACTLVVIRWVIEFITWTTIDSGWAQVIGSIAALGVAIYVMSRQNKHAAKLIVDADLRVLTRRADSIVVLMLRARKNVAFVCADLISAAQSGSVSEAEAAKFSAIYTLQESRRVLSEIPAYDLGDYELTLALQNMIDPIHQLLSWLEQVTTTDLLSDINSMKIIGTEMTKDATAAHDRFVTAVAALRAL